MSLGPILNMSSVYNPYSNANGFTDSGVDLSKAFGIQSMGDILSQQTGLPVANYPSWYSNFATNHADLSTLGYEPSYSWGKKVGSWLGNEYPNAIPSISNALNVVKDNVNNNLGYTVAGAKKDWQTAKDFGNALKTDFKALTPFEKVQSIGSILDKGFSAYNTHKYMSMQREAMDLAKKQWQMDWNNKTKMINSQLADRQARRYAEDPEKTMSVNDYMKQYGVS